MPCINLKFNIKDFDSLLNYYSDNQINALAYKMIQKFYQENKIDYLKMWQKRSSAAISDKMIPKEISESFDKH